MIDIAITPDRGDCLGVYGIARDLAATGIGTLQSLKTAEIKRDGTSPIQITIQDEHCPAFAGCVVKGVKNGASPEWMQRRLKAIGLRPISSLVDITNYISYDLGRPLHVYDLAKLEGNIIVRKGDGKEQVLALNEKEYTLDPDTCVIADEKKALGIGGIMGGERSGCTEETTDVLIECALFDAVNIAQTGRKLNIISDARYRFERGVDAGMVEPGIDIATQMVIELCGGIACERVITGSINTDNGSVGYKPEMINGWGGTDVPSDEIESILDKLGFSLTGDQAQIPSWRHDIEVEADIVEEVLRIKGYEHIPNTPLPKPEQIPLELLTPQQTRIRETKRLLTLRGIHEVISWAFLDKSRAKLFGWESETLRISNPISEELGIMRPSLLPNLIDAAVRNADRGVVNIALFESGLVFNSPAPEGQVPHITAIRTGNASEKNIYNDARTVDFLDAKADAFEALTLMGMDCTKIKITRDVPAWYHPGSAGALTLGGKIILGYFGELHPATLQAMNCKQHVVGFELLLDAIPLSKKKKSKNRAKLVLSEFQANERDFAFIVNEDLPANDLLQAISCLSKSTYARRQKIFGIIGYDTG
jgi:phenylalanyl-tRNA synthetase beta chain